LREAAVVGVRHIDGRAAGLRRRARDAGVFRGAAAGREAGGERRARDFEVGAHAAEGVVVLLAVDGAWAAVGLAAAIAEVHLVVRAGVAVDASRNYLQVARSAWDSVMEFDSSGREPGSLTSELLCVAAAATLVLSPVGVYASRRQYFWKASEGT